MYSLNDTCDKCTLDQYIKAVYEGNPRAILTRGYATKKTLYNAILKLCEEFSRKNNGDKQNETEMALMDIYKVRSDLDCLTMAYNMARSGRYDAPVEYIYTHYHIRKKNPSDEEERKSLVNAISSLMKKSEIKLKELEQSYSRKNEKKEDGQSAREVFLSNITMFKMGLELTYGISLDMTLSEYVMYSKRYNELIKRINAKRWEKGNHSYRKMR